MNPLPFSRLLLASELTEFDVGATEVALALCAQHGLPLAAVLPLLWQEAEASAPQAVDTGERAFAAARAALEARAASAGVVLTTRVQRTDAADRLILETARTLDSDLLLIRRRGRHGWLSRLLVGEMVSRIIEHAPCALLIAPRAAHAWSRGVAVFDGAPSSTPANAHDAAHLQLAQACAAARGVPLHRLPLGDAATLPAALERAGADLLVLGRTPVPGTTLDALLGAAPCAVLLQEPATFAR